MKRQHLGCVWGCIVFTVGTLFLSACGTQDAAGVQNKTTENMTDFTVTMAAQQTEIQQDIAGQTAAEQTKQADTDRIAENETTVQQAEGFSRSVQEDTATYGDTAGTVLSGKSDVTQEIDSETGMILINDYNPDDRDFRPSDNFISPKDNRLYGETLTVDYYSSALGHNRQADVILPYGYDAKNSYPVLYMLHGLGGNNKSWSDMGVKYIVQNNHYENGVPDMIVVCVSCYVNDGGEGNQSYSMIVPSYDRVEGEILNDLMPYINTHFSTKTGRDNTAIAGYSLGGKEAIGIGFKHQDMFGYIGGFSSAGGVIPKEGRRYSEPMLEDFVLDPQYGDFLLLFLNVGINDGVCGEQSTIYSQDFRDRGIKHIYYQMEGDHEGTVWQNGLYNFVKRIF